MARTFKDVALCWYMSLSRLSVTSYQDLTKRMVQHFSANKLRKVTTTSLFNVRQGPSKSLQEYMARFNKETIKVSHPNQEIFVGAFQNDMKVDDFNESLAQKLSTSMEEVMSIAECYVKEEESNKEKISQDAK